MRRVVVFMGGSRDALGAVQRGLPGAVKVLAGSGVAVPRSGRTGNKNAGFLHQQLSVPGNPAWAELATEAKERDAESMLLVVPGLLRLGGVPAKREQIARRLSELADEVVVVSVVADQLTAINEAYVAQVATWRTWRRLEAVLPRLLEGDLFSHETNLLPWHEDPTLRYVAVPLADFGLADPLGSVLRPAGIELKRTPPASEIPIPPKLGSVGVEANRLLATYLRAVLPSFDPADPRNALSSRAALKRAEKLGWCVDTFWGWPRRAAERAMGHYHASNERFAQAVWGTEWPQPFPVERPCTRVDFLDLDVPVVDQVQRYVMGMAGRIKKERKSR